MPPPAFSRHARIVLAALLLGGLPAAARQETPAPPDRQEGAQSAPAPQAAPLSPVPPPAEPAIHPDAVSRFVERHYRVRPKTLWKGLLQTLKDAGYPPEEVDDERRHVKTSFVDFEAKNFPDPVADPPPLFGPDYPIMQLNRVREGKLSLEAILVPEAHGTTLSLRARILVQGLDRRQRVHVLTDRRSSGSIEKQFLARLEQSLGIEPR